MQIKENKLEFKVVTLNVLAPCYKRQLLGDRKVFESEFEQSYLARNKAICEMILDTEPDIICLQEFWGQSETLRRLYTDAFCNSGKKYSMNDLRRTSHWRQREDGLAVFVNQKRVKVLDCRDILFHDCGDRVAQLLLLGIDANSYKPNLENDDTEQATTTNFPLQRFLVLNTHLLFPHNEYSTKIRLREVSKMLGFVEAYRQKELCDTICGRSDVSDK
jgi:hypothetical protein